MATLGQGLLLIAVACAFIAAVTSAVGAARGSLSLLTAGVRSTRVMWIASATGAIVLLVALARRDFSLAYVAGHTSTDVSLGFRLTALWSGQEGSLLLWFVMLGGCAVLVQRTERRLSADVLGYATAVLTSVALVFAVLVAFVARPFAQVGTIPADGQGLNPALANYWMALHPPALYVGYVTVAVPFALVAGALLARRRDDLWVRATRRWMLIAWTGLTVGLFLGARWAYEEIGWGGYWAWDPVENAALMPWLVATAYLHSIMVQERRGMLRYWNVVLVSLTFALSIFGTFLTRSGIVSSVHSFVESPVGWYFLGLLAVTAFGAIGLLIARRDLLRARTGIDSFASREATFLGNNVLLVAMALMVLWGVTFPILTEVAGATRVSLQAPYYNFFLVVLGLPLLALAALGPLVTWRRTHMPTMLRRTVWPAIAGVAAGALAVVLGGVGNWPAAAAVALGWFSVCVVLLEITRGARAVQAAGQKAGAPVSAGRAVTNLIGRNRRRYGGYIAHVGVGLLAVGVEGSTLR